MKNSTLLKTIGFAGLLAITASLHAEGRDELKPEWKAAVVGIGLMTAPIPLLGNGLEYWNSTNLASGAVCLEGWGYAATSIFGTFLPPKVNYLAPFIVGGIQGAYRLSQLSNDRKANDLALRKLACDWLGVLGWVTIQIQF